jgi:hypothetical protein
LSHVQARPWNIVPEGVALLISAPEGTTAESLRLALLRHGPWGRDGPVNSMATLVADGTAG